MIDRTEVQGLVLRPRRAGRVDVALVRCPTAGDLRRLIGEVLGPVDPAQGPRPLTIAADEPDGATTALSLGLTAAGLELLGASTRAMDALPSSFRDGMAAAAARLGDDLGQWEPALLDRGPRHAVVVARRPPEAPTDAADWAGVVPDDHGDVLCWTGSARGPRPGSPPAATPAPPDVGYEPFGFRDDISMPVVEGSGHEVRPGNGVWDPEARRWRAVRAGELVLGHVDEGGTVAGHPDARGLERDGSYLVLRKLEQHVDAFDAACATWADTLGFPDRHHVAARFVGRHHDGRALGQPEGAEVDNGFLYRDPTRAQLAVPPSSHIRRSNPRDDIEDAAALVRRHVLFRRGVPYGAPGSGQEGLLFMAACADIRRQFEFVHAEWLQDGNRFGLGAEQDPLTGRREPCDEAGRDDCERRTASTTGPDGSRQPCTGMAPFVTSRGGEYVLLPSVSTLRRLLRPDTTP